ncbi:MAG: putative signal transducing protein [Planctomycetota bacterium]|jgi:hypothetical protein
MGDRLVTIARFADSAQAELAKQRLADAGINSIVSGQNAANVYGGLVVAAVELQVFESQAQEALKILETNREKEEQEQ